jgi:FKBP-type peptidyl-prolyl cis-trans isomerase FkpA
MKRAIVLIALLATAGCGSDSSTSPTVPPTSVGVFTVTDLSIGTGVAVASGNNVTVAYTGWLYDTSKAQGKGAQFDSNQSFPLRIGAGQVIAGWDQGIPGMKVGGQRRLIIPPELAYGSSSPTSSIPANATLVFDIALKSIP